MSNPPSDGDGPRLRLVRRWAVTIAATAYAPMSRPEVEQFLLGLVDSIVDGIRADRLDSRQREIERIGEALVGAHFTGPQSLQKTLEVLGAELPSQPELAGVDRLEEKMFAVLG